MNIAWHDLRLLEAVAEVSTVTQRALAARLGIALGLTNLYLKRLIRKGDITCVTMRPNRLAYSITPQGAARKARLTLDFVKYSLDLYRDARRRLRRGVDARLAPRPRVAIYGTGEAAELTFLLLHEIGIDPVATFDAIDGKRFLGMQVMKIGDHALVPYDVLVVATLDTTQAIVTRLLDAGVPKDKLLLLHQEALTRNSEMASNNDDDGRATG